MSAKELNRLEVLRRVLERRLRQAQAAEQLGLGTRQGVCKGERRQATRRDEAPAR